MTRVVFLGGFGRSGTTLLERVLDQLPNVCSLGEVTHLWYRGLLRNERCGCQQPFHSCPFWQGVGQEAFGGWHQVDAEKVHDLGLRVDRTRFVPSMVLRSASKSLRSRSRDYADYYARVYAAAARVSGASVVVDSSKNASLAFALRNHPDIDLHIVHVVRDSRGVAYSWTKDVARPEAGAVHQQMDKYRPWKSAVLWNAHNAFFEVLRHQGTPVCTLRYEQFLHDTGSELPVLDSVLGRDGGAGSDWAFLGRDSVQLRPSHTVAGNPMRFVVGRLGLREDDAWRSRLSGFQQREVTALTLPLLRRYGYL